MLKTVKKRASSNNPFSQYQGVYWRKQTNKWRSCYRDANKIVVHIGYYDEEFDAAKAYDAKMLELGLPYTLNFPTPATPAAPVQPSTFIENNMTSTFKIKLIAGNPCVSAREIHKSLQLSSPFSVWSKSRLSNMQPEVDYLPATRPGDLYFTLEGAKVAAMLERGGRGFDVRKELMEFEQRHANSFRCLAAQVKTVELDADTVMERLTELESKMQQILAVASNPSALSIVAPAPQPEPVFYTLAEYYEVYGVELPTGIIGQLIEKELIRWSENEGVEVKELIGEGESLEKAFQVDILAEVTGF